MSAKSRKPNRKELIDASKAWAKFLYSEYCLEKNLLNQARSNTINNATNHDKLNT